MATSEDEHDETKLTAHNIPIEQMLSLNDPFEGHVATCVRSETKAPGSSPATILAMWRGELSPVITRLMSTCLWSGWKW